MIVQITGNIDAAKKLAQQGYGWEDLRAKLGLSAEVAKTIVWKWGKKRLREGEE